MQSVDDGEDWRLHLVFKPPGSAEYRQVGSDWLYILARNPSSAEVLVEPP